MITGKVYMEQKIREFDKWYEQYVDELFSYGMAFGMEKEYVLDVIHDVFFTFIRIGK